MVDFPMVLIISHNLFDDTNNIGKTLVSLMQGWPKDKIAQICFRNDQPSFNHCENYYCITDKEVFRSLLTFNIRKPGNILAKTERAKITDTEKSLYRVGNKRVPIISLIRDQMWNIGTWKTLQLKKWISKISPDVILFVPNDYSLAYKVCLFVRSFTNIPIIPYYMDDAFYYDCVSTLVDHLRRLYMRKNANYVHQYSKKIFTISEKMNYKYTEIFGLPCRNFMNSVIPSGLSAKEITNCSVVMAYIGNLHSNRWKSLCDIGEVVDRINRNSKNDIKIKVYTASNLGKRELDAIRGVSCISLEGCISPSEVQKYQREANVLIHIEAFDKKSSNSTKYSLSTKIPEYLNSGVSILAYGPEDIASIEYLRNNELAYVCSKKNELEETIRELLNNPEYRLQMEKNGLVQACTYHDASKVSGAFISEILDLVEKKKI